MFEVFLFDNTRHYETLVFLFERLPARALIAGAGKCIPVALDNQRDSISSSI